MSLGLLVLAQLMVRIRRFFVCFLNSRPRTGHIPPLHPRAALHVVPTCCGWGGHWDICGTACLRDVWVCVRLEPSRERWLGGGGRVDERAGTGSVIHARRRWTLFLFLSVTSIPLILWCFRHVLVKRPSLGLHSHLCAELMVCGCYAKALLLLTVTFRTPHHHPYAMKVIDLL